MPARKPQPGIYARVSKRTGKTVYDAVAHVDGKQKWSRGHATPSLARAEQDQMRADLRHVHATLLARAGVHPSVMAERLGHADASLSLNVYTHTHAGQQVEAAAAVEALLR